MSSIGHLYKPSFRLLSKDEYVSRVKRANTHTHTHTHQFHKNEFKDAGLDLSDFVTYQSDKEKAVCHCLELTTRRVLLKKV